MSNHYEISNCTKPKPVSTIHFGHQDGHINGDSGNLPRDQLLHHHHYIPTPSSLTTTTTVLASPHVGKHHHVEVSNNLHHGTHASMNVFGSTNVTQDAPLISKHTPTTETTNNFGSNSTTMTSFPFQNNIHSNSNHTKPREDEQTFIVDYMFKENVGIKKSKKIKRKYEFKRKESNQLNGGEKPVHVKVSYLVMDEEELDSCGNLNDAIERHLNANETRFEYSNEQQVSIIKVDPNAKQTRKRTVENITTNEMIRILHLTQQQACTLLGCSLSTIKRKFYSIRNELGIDKWPHNYLEYRNFSFFDNFYPMSLKFILNNETNDEDSNS